MAEPKRFPLPRVADLHHVADLSNHLGLIFFASLFQKTFKRGSRIEVIFDGILALAGDDDDVLDAGGDALFDDILNLRLVDNGEHFFRLRLGGGQETRAESSGREDRLADFLRRDRGAVRRDSAGRGRQGVSHSLNRAHTG